MDPIEVREARRDDAETIVEFQVRMAMESEGLALDSDTVTKGVAAVFDDPAKGRYYVAEADGRIVGSLLTVAEWSDWRNATVLWIHSVYIVPEARRRGVFRQLYEALRAMVEASAELAGLRLYVEKGNDAAQQVYRALGMSPDHYDMYEWLK